MCCARAATTMRDNGGTLVDIVPRLLSRIEVQGGVKEDNNIELPLRGIFHIFGASPPPFAPYSRICAAPPHTHARTPPPPFPLLVEPLNSPPFRFLRSFSRSSASEQRHGVPRSKSSFTKPIARAKSHRGSSNRIEAAFSSRLFFIRIF